MYGWKARLSTIVRVPSSVVVGPGTGGDEKTVVVIVAFAESTTVLVVVSTSVEDWLSVSVFVVVVTVGIVDVLKEDTTEVVAAVVYTVTVAFNLSVFLTVCVGMGYDLWQYDLTPESLDNGASDE